MTSGIKPVQTGNSAEPIKDKTEVSNQNKHNAHQPNVNYIPVKANNNKLKGIQ